MITKAVAPKIAVGLTQDQVNEIVALFDGSLIKTGADLVDKLKRSQSVRITDPQVEIAMTTDDLWNLKQQAVGMSRDYHEYVKEFIEDCISLQLNGSYKNRRW